MLKERILSLKALLDEEKERREKYKIEVFFGNRKTTQVPFPGSVVIMRSGSAMSGDGDEIVYPCLAPGPRCPGLIPPENISPLLNYALCPHCNFKTKPDDLKDGSFYKVDAEKWAYVLAREFYRCNCDASIYMHTSEVDLRKQSGLELARPQHGDALRVARGSRKAVMYERYRILQDVSTGASLEKQLKALITA